MLFIKLFYNGFGVITRRIISLNEIRNAAKSVFLEPVHYLFLKFDKISSNVDEHQSSAQIAL